MARYFFHLIDEDLPVSDEDGIELADDAVASTYAIHCARDIIAETIRTGQIIRLASSLLVADQAGRELQRIRFSDVITLDHGDAHLAPA
jgi:hypothetical protein